MYTLKDPNPSTYYAEVVNNNNKKNHLDLVLRMHYVICVYVWQVWLPNYFFLC